MAEGGLIAGYWRLDYGARSTAAGNLQCCQGAQREHGENMSEAGEGE
jgi:hypothetical protein